MFRTWVSEAMVSPSKIGAEEVKDHDWERRMILEFGIVYICVACE